MSSIIHLKLVLQTHKKKESQTKTLLFDLVVLCHIRTIETLECYYCHDEEGYYCPRPFPLKSMYKTEEKYREQLTNIAIISSNEQSNVAVISCFVRMTNVFH